MQMKNEPPRAVIHVRSEQHTLFGYVLSLGFGFRKQRLRIRKALWGIWQNCHCIQRMRCSFEQRFPDWTISSGGARRQGAGEWDLWLGALHYIVGWSTYSVNL